MLMLYLSQDSQAYKRIQKEHTHTKFSNNSFGWPMISNHWSELPQHRKYYIYTLSIRHNEYSIYVRFVTNDDMRIYSNLLCILSCNTSILSRAVVGIEIIHRNRFKGPRAQNTIEIAPGFMIYETCAWLKWLYRCFYTFDIASSA